MSVQRIKRMWGRFWGLLCLFILVACSGNPNPPASTKETPIRIGYVNWAEAVVVSNLWKLILENEGYSVQLVELDVAPLYQGLADGELDLFLDAWLPLYHKNYWEKFSHQLEDLGSWYESPAYTGIAVPAYVEEVNSIADLKTHHEMFAGKIYGIEAGASVMQLIEDEVIPQYDLPFELVASSEAAMLSEVRKAYAQQAPIVFLGWTPHWMFDEWELKYLQDPLKIIPEGEELRILARRGFSEQYPDVAAALQRFTLSDEHLSKIENRIFNQGEDETAVIQDWVERHPEWVNQWLGR